MDKMYIMWCHMVQVFLKRIISNKYAGDLLQMKVFQEQYFTLTIPIYRPNSDDGSDEHDEDEGENEGHVRLEPDKMVPQMAPELQQSL
jgi:hypothetical protein